MALKERVRAYCDSKAIPISGFEKQAKLSNGYFNRVKRRPSPDKLDNIASAFPDLNMDWLLTGEGEMLTNPGRPAPTSKKIRYWVDVDATGGGAQLFDDSITTRYIDLDIPEFHDCSDAVNLYGDSMVPLYKSGQIIILKEWCENYIDFGNVYLVVTRNGNRMVKYLRKGSDDAHILCVSENKDFDPFEIEKADILRLYLVKGGIIKNTL